MYKVLKFYDKWEFLDFSKRRGLEMVPPPFHCDTMSHYSCSKGAVAGLLGPPVDICSCEGKAELGDHPVHAETHLPSLRKSAIKPWSWANTNADPLDSNPGEKCFVACSRPPLES